MSAQAAGTVQQLPSETERRKWIALVVLCAGFLMIILDQTIVNVALPSIQTDLHFSQSNLAWVINAYLIAFGGLLLLVGRLGDLIGRRRIFLAGLTLFTAASLACGLATSQGLLIGARFVQGIGGAMTAAVILGMIVTMFPQPSEQAKAIGVYSFVAAAGGAIGLLAGGVLTQAINWHWIFFVNLPIGVATAILATRLLPDDRGIGLRNPMSTDAMEMRVSLLPGLLAVVAHNRRQGESWVRSFEIGNVFWTDGTIRERKVIGGVLLGSVPQRGLLGDSRPESFYDAKGVVEALLEGLGVAPVRWGALELPSFLHPGKAATVRREADVLGYAGGLHPEVAKAADVGDAWGFELDFAKLESYARRRFTFQPLPKYPAIVRDLAIVADETFEAQAVLETIDVCSDLPVESAQLFDLYRGDPLPAGKKSLAYSIAYRDPSRTLTDEEVNRLHQSLIERITRQLGVALRA